MNIEHNSDEEKFQIETEGSSDVAELQYTLDSESGTVDFHHTFVPESFRGQGVAGKLAEAGLGWAKEQDLKVKASCPYIESYIQKHPESVAQ